MKIIEMFFPNRQESKNHMDLDITRPGQDVRYSIDDSKLKALGWKPKAVFEVELVEIVEYYKKNFIY